MKPKLTKQELKVRILEEANAMRANGIGLTLAECKRQAERVFRSEFQIV
jgi:hypothetical protein